MKPFWPVKPEFAALVRELDITILGEAKRAVIIGEIPWDPENVRLRA